MRPGKGTGKGKRAAILIVGLASVAVAVAAVSSWRRIAESWYLRKLEDRDAAGKRAAVEKLGEMKSVRAVDALAKAFPGADQGLKRAILDAAKSIGPEAAPVIFRAMERHSREADFKLNRLAADTLTEMGPADVIGAKTTDPTLRMRYADALAEKGRKAEALEQYLWCFDHGNDHERGFAPVRLSFLLHDITELGASYPPAMEALRERMDRLEERLLAQAAQGTRPLEAFSSLKLSRETREFTRLSEVLEEPARILSLFTRSRDLKGGPALRAALLDEAIDTLLDEHRYAEIVEAAPKFEGRLIRNSFAGGMLTVLGAWRKQEPMDRPGPLLSRATVEYGRKLYEALLGAGHVDRAAALARQLIALSPSGENYSALVRHALRAGKSAQAEELLGQAEKALKSEELEKVREAMSSAGDSVAEEE